MTRTRGFTLVELMVAMALTAVVVVYLLATFSNQHKTYEVVDQVTEAQQSARAAASLIQHDLREAGYMVPHAAAVCAWDSKTGPDTLFVSDSDAILPLAAPPGDPSLKSFGVDTTNNLYAEPASVGPGWKKGPNGAAITLNQDYLDVSGTPDFTANAGVIVLDEKTGNTACGIINSASPSTNLSIDFGTTSVGPVTGSIPDEIRIVPAHVYQIATPVPGGPTVLERDGMPLVPDAEDLQVAIFLDKNGNGLVDPGEYEGEDNAQPTYDPSTSNGSELSEVRFDLVVKTRDPDPDKAYQSGMPQATENRNPFPASAFDGFRRRVFTATVRPRNEGL